MREGGGEGQKRSPFCIVSGGFLHSLTHLTVEHIHTHTHTHTHTMSAVSGLIASQPDGVCPISFPGPLSKIAAESFCQMHGARIKPVSVDGWDAVRDDLVSGRGTCLSLFWGDEDGRD